MEAPRLAVGPAECVAAPGGVQHPGEAARWRVTWRVDNGGTAPIELRAAWLPHGRFRGDGRVPLAEHLEPEGSVRLEFAVSAAEAPGTVVDNAFLIMRVDQQGQPWRIFVRLRIDFDDRGVPAPIVQRMSTQALSRSAAESEV